MEGREAARPCLGCLNPLCQTGCPVGNRIRDFVQETKKGDLEKAASILYEVNPFPEFTSALCDHERQCKGRCIRGTKGEPVEVPTVEAFLSANFKRNLTKKPANGHRIALIGAGIANLSAAFFLSKKGFEVDVYEKDKAIGGAIWTGIPGFRFDKALLANVQGDLEALGVHFFFGKEVGKDLPLNQFWNGYDSVLLSVGAQKNNMPPFTASKGLLSGLELLRKANLEQESFPSYRKCLVWGGGNVAMDCARTLTRLGKDVTVVYRRSSKEMPANANEVEEAIKEGVRFAFLTNVKDIIKNEKDEVVGAITVAMELGEKDASGRASFHEIADSFTELPCDLLVSAIGQKADLSSFGLEIEKGEGHGCNIPKLFLAGDCRLGPKNIAACIKDGREAAFEIIHSLMD